MDENESHKIRALEQENKRLTERNDLLEKTIHDLQDSIKDMMKDLKSNPLAEAVRDITEHPNSG